MTTATAEAPVKKEAAPEQPPFVMVKPALGQSVLWYQYAQKIPKYSPEIAFVVKVGQKAIDLRTATGRPIAGVPHIDDPRLQNPDMREGGIGAWELPEDRVAPLVAEIADLKRNLAESMARITALEDSKKK